MKNIFRSLIVVFSLMAGMNLLHAQWTHTNGPPGKHVYSLAVKGTTLYAGTGEGVFASTNNGASWDQDPYWDIMPVTSVCALGEDPSGYDYLAGTFTGYVFATNGHTTVGFWLGTKNASDYVTAVVVNGPYRFIGTSGAGVWRDFENNGSILDYVNTGLTNPNIFSFTVIGTNLFVGTGDGVFLSTNNGDSWTAVNAGMARTNVVALAAIGNDVFAGTTTGIYRSSNNGSTWTAANSGLTDESVTTMTADGSSLYAGTDNGVYVSTNNGGEWIPINSGMTGTPITSVAVIASNLFAATRSGGVYRSTNNGTTWTAINNGMLYAGINALAPSGADLFAGTYGGVLHSSDDGATWSDASTGLANTEILSLVASGTKLFAGTRRGFFRSFDNGKNWTVVDSEMTDLMINAIAVRDSIFYAGTSGGIFLSTNNGQNWKISDANLVNDDVRAIVFNGTDVYAGTLKGEVEVSSNNGIGWVAVNNGLEYAYSILSLVVCGGNVFAGTYGEIYRLTDNGSRWVRVPVPASEIFTLAVHDTILFAGIKDPGRYGVYVSMDYGTNWTAANDGLLTWEWVKSIIFSGDEIFIGTNYGFSRRPLSEISTSVQAPSQSVPVHFHLDQNYPNPFNPSTTISFGLPSRTFVSLKIFDVLGRNVATIVFEELPEGNYERRWNATGYPSGAHFYRLQAGSYTETKRLILLR